SGVMVAAVSRTMIAEAPPVIASECRTTCESARRSIPAASASRSASPTPAYITKCVRLRASFMRVPVPIGPACTISADHAPNGATASGRKSHTTSPPGQSTRWRAIGAPIWPRPMKPTRTALSVIDDRQRMGGAVLHRGLDGDALRVVGPLLEHGEVALLRHR